MLARKYFPKGRFWGILLAMSTATDILIIQPPLVQLNTPYPAGAYLKSFFQRLGMENPGWGIAGIRWVDCCNRLFHRIFCRDGLAHIFSATVGGALAQAEGWEREGRHNEAFNVRRYVSQQDGWIRWIEPIVDILLGRGRERCHEFVSSPAVPRGQRVENFMAALDRLPSVDDALILASLALTDLADYITTFYDPSFELVRYGEALAASHHGFDAVERGLDAPVLRDFYRPVLDELAGEVTSLWQRDGSAGRLLVCVSCPFPGTLASALYTCRFFKEAFGRRAFVVMGGGYVNTELRQVREPRLADYLDALSYDRGYGSYWDFFRRLADCGEEGSFPQQIKWTRVYKLRFFGGEAGWDAEACAEERAFSTSDDMGWQEPCWEEARCLEESLTASIIPDFTDIDFSRYPRLADSTNPMHRLWSDGAWLKAYLAHGCYWHQCAFCDTSLDYVCGYRKTDVAALHKSLSCQARLLGVPGIHLVDEAAPPAALRDFALENLRAGDPLVFWGNIRYEKVFSRDLADLLSHGGLRAVSGGIEIASGTGLDAVHKGTDLDSIVSACAAFKEAGILTHAYMIYGYWLETPQILMDSMETLRQLFATGLLDSAFWHKFVLTRHSRVFQEWRRGLHPDLVPLDWQEKGSVFATNDIRFAGEEKSRRYGEPLNAALSAWMRGEGMERPVQKWFPYSMPRPSVSPRLVEDSIARYERRRDAAFRDWEQFCSHWQDYCWLGGRVLTAASPSGKGWRLVWSFMGELWEAGFPPAMGRDSVAEVACWLHSRMPGKAEACAAGGQGNDRPGGGTVPVAVQSVYKRLRRGGLRRIR